MAAPENRWPDVDHALAYLAKADDIPHRAEGVAEVVAHLPERVGRVLDLGTGDGRLLDLVLTASPGLDRGRPGPQRGDAGPGPRPVRR